MGWAAWSWGGREPSIAARAAAAKHPTNGEISGIKISVGIRNKNQFFFKSIVRIENLLAVLSET